ncbi:MAG: bifunctional UDP-N-acetylglucosamine diphosphorylase/glucosamine-1-phosphate N-acetyltransferase GlmU [bacterium]
MTNYNFKVIVLAAGKGTRMKSCIPKVLHKILGKTIIERVLKQVLDTGSITEIFVVVGHQADEVENFINKFYSESICPVIPILQEPQLGTGDAVFRVYDKLKLFKGTVLILCGDTPLLTSEMLAEFLDFHKKSQADLTVLSAFMESSKNYGRIIRNLSGNIEKIVEEKDATPEEKQITEVNAGVYCLEWEKIAPAFFDLDKNNEQGEYYLTDIVQWTFEKGLKVQVYAAKNNDEIFGINSRSDLAYATYLLNSRTIKNLMENGVTVIAPENTWISPETKIGQDTIIYPGCVIEGENIIGDNCILGPHVFIEGTVKTGNNVKMFQSKISNAKISENCSVGPFANIRDNVEISNNVRIGNFVEIKNSVINESTNIAHLSYIGDAELGKDVNIGAGTITANYNALTRQKNRTIIEDNVKIGSNCVLVAPVKISESANVAAGSVITKDVPKNSLAIARQHQKIIEEWVNKNKQLLDK